MRDLSYQLHRGSQLFEYHMVIWSGRAGDASALEQILLAQPEIVHFRISPSRD
ncbi:MAG: hypothetical protein WA900_08395 [Casimicrobiaceae bacterium]